MPVDRFALIAGPYTPTAFRLGDKLLCAVRDRWCIVRQVTDAPIPWPAATIAPRGGMYAPVVTEELERDVRTGECRQAVAHWWGVNAGTVSRWRRRLGVGRRTPGTVRLVNAALPLKLTPEARAKALVWTDERREKIAASRRGKPAQPGVAARLQTFWLGRRHSPESRARMRAVQRSASTSGSSGMPPWTDEEIALLDGLPVNEVHARTSRSPSAIRAKRWKVRRASGGRSDATLAVFQVGGFGHDE